MLGRSAAGLGVALEGSLDGLFGAEAVAHGPRRRPRSVGYGPLVDDPNHLLSLPAGFSYTIVAQSGVTTLESGEPNGLLYRFTPPDDALPLGKGVLKRLADDAGTLEALKATTWSGAHVPDLSVATQHGTTYDVEWVEVPDRDARTVSTRNQFTNDQITRSRKLEGMWWGDGGAYFVCSFARFGDGSAAQHDGQVWFLDPDEDTIELKLHFVYTPLDQDGDPDGPDNVTVSAYGGLIIAEDGEGKQHLVGSSERGETFFFARNDDAASAEFTGPNFSHDRKILFANIQEPGYVFAIRGPFRKQRR